MIECLYYSTSPVMVGYTLLDYRLGNRPGSTPSRGERGVSYTGLPYKRHITSDG